MAASAQPVDDDRHQPTVVRTASPQPVAHVPESQSPDLTCVLVSYGTGPIIVECLRSLADTLVDDGVRFEIVLVDNLHPVTPERTWRLVSTATRGLRVIRPGDNLGFAGGNNLAVRHARGDLIALVNPDTYFTPGWFAPLRSALDTATIAAPVLVNPDQTVQETGHEIYDDGWTRPTTAPVEAGETARPTYSSAACWVLRRSDFERLGGFDEAYWPAYFEDADFALRAAVDGEGTAVVGASRVVHHRAASSDDSAALNLLAQHRRFCERWAEFIAGQPAAPATV